MKRILSALSLLVLSMFSSPFTALSQTESETTPAQNLVVFMNDIAASTDASDSPDFEHITEALSKGLSIYDKSTYEPTSAEKQALTDSFINILGALLRGAEKTGELDPESAQAKEAAENLVMLRKHIESKQASCKTLAGYLEMVNGF